MLFKRILILLYLFVYASSFSQSTKVDSLKQAINNATSDTAVFQANKRLYYYYLNTHEREKTRPIAEEMIRLGKEKKNNYFQGTGYRILGDYYHDVGKDNLALENFLIAINLLEKTDQYVALVSAYTNIGGVYYEVYGPKEASVYFKKALGISKKHNLGDTEGISTLYNNLGICAASEKNNELAKFYFRSALSVWIEEKDSASIAYGFNNIGEINLELKQLDSAKFYFKRALDLKLRFGSNENILGAYVALGLVYVKEKNYTTALDFLKKAEKYIDSVNINKDQARLLITQMANCYVALKDYKNAYLYEKKNSDIYERLAINRNQTGLEKIEKAYSDSLLSAGEKQIRELELANQEVQLKHEKQQKIFLSIGLLVVLLGGVLFYNRYKVTKKQKEIIETQKNIVEEQKKEIVDSINYAYRIQNAVLTDPGVWKSISEQHFVLFRPKDIVSGDFYWAHQVKNKDIWAVADCTGHGVPGAFMSMLANSLLNEIVVEFKVNNAAEILDHLRSKIIAALSKENNQQNDGMDIALCVYDRISGELEFAGANNGAILIRDNTLMELKGDKMPVGKYHGDEKPFTSTRIKLQANDTIYLYTDGFADQFGGPHGKKFRYKQLDELLLFNHTKDMNTQCQMLEQIHLQWKGDLIQTDDVCVVGIKLIK